MHDQKCEVSRREFIKTGTALTAAAAAAGLPAVEAYAEEEPGKGVLAMRKLGKTNVGVSILNLGTAGDTDTRLLNTAWAEGVRYFDTADCYRRGNSEKTVGEWLAKTGRRKDMFIVTKDHPKTPDQWVQMIDARLEALQTDYVDMFFLHGLGAGYMGGGNDKDRGIPKDKEWAKAADTLKKSGKVKFVGFSTHTKIDLRSSLLNEAAVGWPDAIMVASDPRLVRTNSDFNKALDACYKAEVGLICMKEMRAADQIPEVVPEFEKLGLTKYAAVLSAVWTDQRFASICSHMQNLKMVKENAESARTFRPLTDDQMGMLDTVMERYASSFCVGCDGSCAVAAGTGAALGDIVRYLSYYEMDGDRETARRLFRELPPEHRDWSGADLKAAQAACVSNIDFEDYLARAEAKLA
jgi:hypothetical protein